MGGHFVGSFGRRVNPFGFHRGFAPIGFDGGFRSRFRGGFDLPQLGPIGFGFRQPGFFGFPGNPFGFPGNAFGFFGFPRRQFGFFFDGFVVLPFVDGFAFFDGFPFIDGFPVFGGFAHRFGFFGFPGRRAGFFTFPPGGFGLIGPQGVPLGFSPPLVNWDGPEQADTPVSRHAQPVSDTRPTLGRQLAVPGTGSAAGDSLVVERVSVMDVVPATALRLTWRNAGLQPQQVALFLADTAQGVLAAQTLRAPPFRALLEPPPGTAFAGMTVVWPDGTTSTRLVPYRSLAR